MHRTKPIPASPAYPTKKTPWWRLVHKPDKLDSPLQCFACNFPAKIPTSIRNWIFSISCQEFYLSWEWEPQRTESISQYCPRGGANEMRLLCLCTLNCGCILTSGSIQPMVEMTICRRYDWYICKLDAVVGKVCSPNHCVLPLFKLIHWDELIFIGLFWNYNLRSVEGIRRAIPMDWHYFKNSIFWKIDMDLKLYVQLVCNWTYKWYNYVYLYELKIYKIYAATEW